MKSQNARLEERARHDFPEFFSEDRAGYLVKTNGGTICPEFRGSGLAQLVFKFVEVHTIRVGYRYFMTIPVAPAMQHLAVKYGCKVLATAYYDEEGEEYCLTPEEMEANKHIFATFKKDQRPSAYWCSGDVSDKVPSTQ